MKTASNGVTLAAAIGIGVAGIGLVLFGPRLLRAARPTIRAGLKQGLEAYAKLRATAAELAEDVEDLVAEVQAELLHERRPSEPAQDEAEDEKAASPRGAADLVQ